MQDQWGPDLQAVIAVLQTALTPAFLLVALGSLLNILTGRLSRIVDRSRELQDRHAATKGMQHDRLVAELRVLEKRMKVVGLSILLGVLSALTVCAMIGLLFLMGLSSFSMAWIVVAVFMLALGLLAGSLVLFVREVQLATHAIHIPEEYLELPAKPTRRAARAKAG
jgi:ABC-type siderophore export system fused ATPase/permease subunit